jgi:putative phosphoribosyl transferase
MRRWRFADRDDAGRALADALLVRRMELDRAVVLGLPRGGVVVAARVAERLGAPLDVVVVRKIGAPGHPELAMGALALWGGYDAVVRNQDVIRGAGVSDERFEAGRREALEAARQQAAEWGKTPTSLAGRPVVLVDDGLATGASARAALTVVRHADPSRLIMAVPVASTTGCRDVSAVADDVVTVSTPQRFLAVSGWYRDFAQVTDETVRAVLAAAAQRTAE